MFRISRRLDYGLQLMVALAAEEDNRAQSTASLAEKLQIPLPFLHQIGHTLMQAGIIKATPGPRGGLRLNQPADSISVLDIVETLEGKIAVNPQGNDNQGTQNQIIWDDLQSNIMQYLSKITLSQLKGPYHRSLFSMPVVEGSEKLN
jgi:Rrf2 family protein